MSILPIIKYPSEILKQKAQPVNPSEIRELSDLIDSMLDTMYAANGIGLAANQVGILKRIIVIDITRDKNHPPIVLINPQIEETYGLIDSEEGCLSLPGQSTFIKRAEKVLVNGFNREGEIVRLEATGLLARAIQHEIDHLDGILIMDRLSPIKREFFKKRYLKEIKSLKKWP